MESTPTLPFAVSLAVAQTFGHIAAHLAQADNSKIHDASSPQWLTPRSLAF
jgi:hypothetical protein